MDAERPPGSETLETGEPSRPTSIAEWPEARTLLERPRPTQTLRVLVCEDEEPIAEVIAFELEELGYEVVGVARNGLEAVDAALSLDPDVLLLDVNMPHMDGLAVCEKLLREHPLPIVMVTCYDDPEFVVEVEAAGAQAYVLKPTDGRRLRVAITLAHPRFQSMQARQLGLINFPGRRLPFVTFENGAHEAVDGRPAAGDDNSSMPSDDALADSSARISVAVMGADQLIAEALAAMLGGAPDLQVVARTGHDEMAIALLCELRPDVALLSASVMTPALTEMVLRLRQACPELKIIVLSSVLEDEALYGCVQAGAAGYVNTDSSSTDLIGAIRRAHIGEVLFPPTPLVKLILRPPQPSEASRQVQPLGRRELEVLRTLAAGASTEESAELLGITVHTVRTHLKNAMAKLQARSKHEAIMIALKEGLIDLPT
jgi:DNA-binding NarL/FixJ family response regulator